MQFLKKNPTHEKERKKEGGKNKIKRSELEVVHALLIFPKPFANKN
jgi:hypothetical protein